ncbi:MAG: glycosyltransferase family 39 protein, partial [Bacteroidota bacterium]
MIQTSPSWKSLDSKNWVILFFTLLLIALFGGLHIMDLRGEEPRRALVAWEMIFNGNYWQPTIQNLPYYNKPPIFNWVVALFFKIFGDANWVVRLPSIIGFLTMAGIHYRFTSRELGPATGLWSTLFLLTAVHFLFFATVLSGELDLFYALFVYLQAISIYHFYHRKQFLALFLVSYTFLAIGFLTKGLPSIAFQGLTLVGMAIYHKSWRWFFSWQHILGGSFALLIIGAYFQIYDQNYGNGWLYLSNLLEEATQKSAAEGRIGEIIKQLFEFPLQFIVDHLPWSLLLFLYLKKDNRALLKQQPFLVFCLLFFVVNIWLYWISPGSRNRYLYAFAPFFLTPLAYLYTQKPLIKWRTLWMIITVFAVLRITYNYTIMAYQQKTMKNVQLYRGVAEDAIGFSGSAPVFTCCQ